MDEMNWSAAETVRSFCLERAARPGLTSLEWAENVAGRLAADLQVRGENLAATDREQLAWLIGQRLEDALAVVRDDEDPGSPGRRRSRGRLRGTPPRRTRRRSR
jgi:hypothetical protein